MVDLMDDLDEFVAGLDEDAPDEPPPPPEDAETANRLLRRIRGYERERERVLRVANDEIGRVSAWRDDRLSGLDRSIDFVRRSIEAWMRGVHAVSGGKVKTQKLPNGESRIRPARAKVVVDDEDSAVVAVETLGLDVAVRTKREVDKKDLLAAVRPGDRLDAQHTAPDGYEWRAAVTENVAGFVVIDGWFVVPVAAVVPHVSILWPTRPAFSYSTSKDTEVSR